MKKADSDFRSKKVLADPRISSVHRFHRLPSDWFRRLDQESVLRFFKPLSSFKFTVPRLFQKSRQPKSKQRTAPSIGSAKPEVVPGEARVKPFYISVCMPCWNTAPFLKQRLDSILAQTLVEFEVVVLDSHSDDGSWEIICDYAARDARIRAYQEPRRGLYADWNACLAQARHEWIYIATSDDTMKPDALQRLAAAAVAHPEATVIGSRKWLIDWSERTLSGRLDLWGRIIIGTRYWRSGWCNLRREALHGILLGPPFESVTQILLKRSLFDRTGWFSSDYGYSGDAMLQLRIMQTERVYFVAERLGSWRLHPGQISNKGGYYENMGRIACDAVRMKIIPSDWVFNVAVGFTCGIAGTVKCEDLPPLIGRVTQKIRKMEICHRPKIRLAGIMIIAGLNLFYEWSVRLVGRRYSSSLSK